MIMLQNQHLSSFTQVHLSVCFLSVCSPVHLCVCVTIWLPVCQFICLSLCPSASGGSTHTDLVTMAADSTGTDSGNLADKLHFFFCCRNQCCCLLCSFVLWSCFKPQTHRHNIRRCLIDWRCLLELTYQRGRHLGRVLNAPPLHLFLLRKVYPQLQ